MRRRLFVCLCLFAPALLAADADFNGRWNIHVKTPRNRVWWLEVRGAGTPTVTGSFVGALGGQVDPVTNFQIQNGTLQFSFDRTRDGKPLRQSFQARLEDGVLKGTGVETLAGEDQPALPWTGIRAPEIRDRDGAEWTAGMPLQLINGKDLTGWHLLRENAPGWVMENGLLKNQPGSSDLVSDTRFWNFELLAEYRYREHSNSGIGLRGRYEIQIYDDFGQAPDKSGHGALYSRIAPRVNASAKPGQWQTLQARLVGRTLTVRLNGRVVLDHVEIVGPTALTMDADESAPGPVVLQGDHGPIEFRRLDLVPLRLDSH